MNLIPSCPKSCTHIHQNVFYKFWSLHSYSDFSMDFFQIVSNNATYVFHHLSLYFSTGVFQKENQFLNLTHITILYQNICFHCIFCSDFGVKNLSYNKAYLKVTIVEPRNSVWQNSKQDLK